MSDNFLILDCMDLFFFPEEYRSFSLSAVFWNSTIKCIGLGFYSFIVADIPRPLSFWRHVLQFAEMFLYYFFFKSSPLIWFNSSLFQKLLLAWCWSLLYNIYLDFCREGRQHANKPDPGWIYLFLPPLSIAFLSHFSATAILKWKLLQPHPRGLMSGLSSSDDVDICPNILLSSDHLVRIFFSINSLEAS